MSGLIYHITSKDSWSAALMTGWYSPESLAEAGFIHCSKESQIIRVANAYYSRQHGLMILEIDPLQLTPEVRWEAGTDKADELFPHIYGSLNREAVIRIFDFEPNPDGKYILPAELLGTT